MHWNIAIPPSGLQRLIDAGGEEFSTHGLDAYHFVVVSLCWCWKSSMVAKQSLNVRCEPSSAIRFVCQVILSSAHITDVIRHPVSSTARMAKLPQPIPISRTCTLSDTECQMGHK